MAHILLLRPPAIFSRTSYSAAMTMPVALAYLAANLRKNGHRVSVLDAMAEDFDHVGPSYAPNVCYRGLSTEGIVERMPEKPDAVAVSTMFSQDWPHIEDMLAAVRRRLPDVPVILGGEHATAASEYVLKSCASVTHVGLGEGDELIVRFAEWIDGKRPIEEVHGIHYRDRSGKIVRNPPLARIKALDDLPWPAWQLFDIEPYLASGEGHGVERGRSMPILATRGCPYRCAFCSNRSMWGGRYFMRTPKFVVDEIEHYVKKYRATNIDFFDLTAIVKRGWTMKFCEEIRRRKLKFTWQLPSGTRTEALDDEVLAAMAETGCRNLTYAPESGSPRTLKYIHKKMSLPKLMDSLRYAKKHGIFVKCNLIIGFPKETRWDMLRSVWTAVRFAVIGADDTGLYPYSPYPGSEFFDYLRSTGKIGEMNREYFTSLMSFMDLKQSSDYCENVGPREVQFYRLLGMCLFYLLAYGLRPARVLRAFRNYREGRSDTVFEQRFFGLLKRWRLEGESRKDPEGGDPA